MWKQFPEKYTHNKSKAKKYQFVLGTYLVPSFMDHYCMNMKKQFILSLPQCVIYRLISWKFMTKIYKSKIYQKPGSHVDRGVIVLPNFINHQQKTCLQSRNLKNKILNYTGKTNTIFENYNVQSRKSLLCTFWDQLR